MKKDMKQPSEEIAEFLNYIDFCAAKYNSAYDAVNEEDKKLQDLIHAMEFAENAAERNKIAKKLQQSRRVRRINKDETMRYQLIANYFSETKNRTVMNEMKQLLGKQRKEETFLKSERRYIPKADKKDEQN